MDLINGDTSQCFKYVLKTSCTFSPQSLHLSIEITVANMKILGKVGADHLSLSVHEICNKFPVRDG